MVSDWKKAAWSRSEAAEESSAATEDSEDTKLSSAEGGEQEKKYVSEKVKRLDSQPIFL